MDLFIVAAPNAFKGSLLPDQAARAMARGILKAAPGTRVAQIPVSDGGDGLIAALCSSAGGTIMTKKVHDPRMRPVMADYLLLPDKSAAVIEMALASGLALLPEDLKDPCQTTTLGTGELILAALDQGATRILMGIGGSATNDGGMGAAAALGYRFLDQNGRDLPPVGSSLGQVCAIDARQVDPRIFAATFSVACDVTNPLSGPLGAAAVFGPQKGASPQQVRDLDQGLANLARVIKQDLGKEVDTLKGAGAAGGLGGGMAAFFNATLCPGIDLVLDLIDFQTRIQGADLVLTGEGSMDSQTRFNKAPTGVARAARSIQVPCLAICGNLGPGGNELTDIGIDAVFSLCPGPMSLEQAMTQAEPLLCQTSEQVVRAFLTGRKIHDR